jgi:hypothetical protein
MDDHLTREEFHRIMEAQTWKLIAIVCSFYTVLVSATYLIARYSP